MKGHSLPSRTVVQIIGITPLESFNVMNTDNKMDRRAPPARLKKAIFIKLATIEAINSVVNTIFQQVFIGFL